MKKALKTISFLFSFLFILNCEEIDVVELEIEHSEKIVIQGELIANEFFEGIYVSKTIPLSEQYDPLEAEVLDATLFLIVDSIKIIPLHYKGLSMYGPISEYKIRSNETYELSGLINGNEIYCKTTVPKVPIISDQKFVRDGYLSTVVKSNEGEAYGAIWLILNDRFTKPSDQAEDFHTIVLAEGSEDKFIRTINIDAEYLSSIYSDKIYLQVFSFDKSYYNYFFTKNNNNPIDDTFSQGGGPISWNVKGDNVIGMFIGIAKTEFIHIKP